MATMRRSTAVCRETAVSGRQLENARLVLMDFVSAHVPVSATSGEFNIFVSPPASLTVHKQKLLLIGVLKQKIMANYGKSPRF
jgi:hypothetical protein